MKSKLILATIAVAFAASSGVAAANDVVPSHNHMAERGGAAYATKADNVKTHSAIGTVKKIDVLKGTVTLAHGPIASLGWPAMTMTFSVKDKQLFNKIKVGRQLAFEFQQQGADNVVTAVK